MSPEEIVVIFKCEVCWLFQDKDEHLELMDGMLVDLLNAKWNAFVKFRYMLKCFIIRVGNWYWHYLTGINIYIVLYFTAQPKTYRHKQYYTFELYSEQNQIYSCMTLVFGIF